MQGHQHSWCVVGKGRASAVERVSADPQEEAKPDITMEVAISMVVSFNMSITLMANFAF